MDTKFWGPQGWKLLHLIVYTYPQEPTKYQRRNYAKFFNSFQYVLPCRYCRESLIRFYKEVPIEDYLDSRNKMTEWMYLIHNKVNEKLQKQGLLNESNPSQEYVDNMYKNYLKNKCQLIGWNFIYSIAFNYLENGNVFTSNKIEQLKNQYTNFFNYLGKYISCGDYRVKYKEYIIENPLDNALKNQSTLTRWLYGLNSQINSKIDKSEKGYQKLTKLMDKVRVKNCKKQTCRKPNIKS